MRSTLLLILLCLVGCVGKKKYTLLVNDFNDANALINDLNADVEDLNGRLDSCKEQSEKLATDKANLLQDQDALQSSVTEMQKALV